MKPFLVVVLFVLMGSPNQAQTVKTNLLAPLSVYGEFKTKPKQTFQVGLSYVPNILSLGSTNDASIVMEYRVYNPKIGKRMDKLWEKSFPRGPFLAPYVKFSLISNTTNQSQVLYAGITAGRKQMRLLGKPKKVIEGFVGFGLGSNLFSNDVRIPKTQLDFRFGVAIGLHYAKNPKTLLNTK